MLFIICCIGIHFRFGLPDCVPYNKDFVILRFVILKSSSMHFILTFAGLKNMVCYTKDFVI